MQTLLYNQNDAILKITLNVLLFLHKLSQAKIFIFSIVAIF